MTQLVSNLNFKNKKKTAMTVCISHKAISVSLDPKVVTYRDLVTTSPNSRSDQAKSEQ